MGIIKNYYSLEQDPQDATPINKELLKDYCRLLCLIESGLDDIDDMCEELIKFCDIYHISLDRKLPIEDFIKARKLCNNSRKLIWNVIVE